MWKMPVERFNRLCLFLTLLWLGVSVPLGIIYRPTVPDFDQFYLAGVVAHRGDWEALYPVPAWKSRDNPGLSLHSYAKRDWKIFAWSYGAPDHTHFILPPPTALLLIPLSFLTYTEAFWAWTAVLTVCVWAVGALSGRILRELSGRATYGEGVLALLVCFSPMTARAIRIANVSPLTAVAISIGVLGTLQIGKTRPVRTAAALVIGAMLKYATLILAPVYVVLGRWKTLLWLIVLGAAALGVTWVIAGKEIFQEFYKVILPTLARPSWYHGNQSLAGMLSRIFGRPFPAGINVLYETFRFASLATILLMIFLRPRRVWASGTALILSACGALIGWLLVFSPIAWEHWPIFLCPLWGWLLWEIRGNGPLPVRITAALSWILMYFPAGIMQVPGFFARRLVFPEPWNSSQLIGMILFTTVAFWRLSGEPAASQELAQVRKLDAVAPERQAG